MCRNEGLALLTDFDGSQDLAEEEYEEVMDYRRSVIEKAAESVRKKADAVEIEEL